MSGVARAARASLAGALLAAASMAVAASELRAFTADSVAAIRNAHAGRAFVLVFWSIDCAPCREELPHWSAWRTRHPQVPIVLVSTDDATRHGEAGALLARGGAPAPQAWGFADEHVERLRWSVDPRWQGELPKTYFHDAAHRVQVRTGKLDTDWVERWLAEQSAHAPPP